MTTISKNFEFQSAESKWYTQWLEQGLFSSKPDNRPAYTVVIPPPNVTGVLHMGHCLNNTIQDVLVRRARMSGYNACWVPGTDHASIATEAKVVQMLRERGIAKSSLSREEFLQYAWEWKEKYGGIILQQLKKLGCSLDWNRTCFTMDDHYYQSVINVFIDLYHKGSIYRGKRMINWDVKAQTALSDEEVIRKETTQNLYYLKYQVEGSDDFITIATVRPETIMGDTAVCVHPKDVRYKHLHGKRVIVPLINRSIPIITDDYVTMEFGTGALKVTPAHDMNDYQLGIKHQLEVIDILNDDGTLNADAQILIGEDRFDARKKIIPLLETAGALLKTEPYLSEVGYSERTDVVVEPRLSLQWWVDMKKIAKPALDAVMNEDIQFYPSKFKNLYKHWMENIKDWCISRQLWWGHRIPAWYNAQGDFVVAANIDEALTKFETQHNQKLTPQDIHQDEDCLDTWFSSWLWPFEVFKGYSQPQNQDIQYYYPTATLVTAPEIIFFWVARMIMAGYEYMGQLPFKQVYFTGIVRDKQGRKMSKSLGNSPDLLALIDQYGADAVRFGILISSPAGNDLLWDESSNEQGRNFVNKMWNALKLIKMWEEKLGTTTSTPLPLDKNTIKDFPSIWFYNRLHEAKNEVNSLMEQFKLSEALKTIYSLVWDDFCSWYLEWIKPGYDQTIEHAVLQQAKAFMEELMQLLHPFMPFVTEEIYQQIHPQKNSICIAQLSSADLSEKIILDKANLLKQAITALRDARNRNQLKPKDTIVLHISTAHPELYADIQNILAKQVNASSVSFTQTAIANSIVVAVEQEKFYIEANIQIDKAALKEELIKDLTYQQNFLQSVLKKLSNEKFVANAKPEVVEAERKKQADAEARIKTIQESLNNL